jgi:hypothetical protein
MSAEATCRACLHFRNDPGWIESVVTGLATMGSAWGSTRADDGICLRHDRFTSADGGCAGFAGRATLAPLADGR